MVGGCKRCMNIVQGTGSLAMIFGVFHLGQSGTKRNDAAILTDLFIICLLFDDVQHS